MELIGNYTDIEKELLEVCNNLVIDGRLLIRTIIIERVTRRSETEFDLELAGYETVMWKKEQHITGIENGVKTEFTIPANEESRHQFLAWLPLHAIKELTNWTSEEIAYMSDYPDMAMEGDWSAIRDSSLEKIWQIFYHSIFE